MKLANFRQSTRILFVLCMVFGLMGCGSDSMVGQLWGQMSELFEVKQAIDESLTEGETAIEIQNGKVITLGLVNTEFNDVDAEERQLRWQQLKARVAACAFLSIQGIWASPSTGSQVNPK